MTQPQWSPDRQWWWDGTRWVPAAQAPQPPPASPDAAPAPAEPAAPSDGAPASSDPWTMPSGQAPAAGTQAPAAGSPQGAPPPWAQQQPGPPAAATPPWAQQPAGSPPWGQQPPAPYGSPTYGGAPPYGAAPPYGMPPAKSGTDGKAVASLVLGIFWVLGLGSVAAVVLGHLSRRDAKQGGREPSGLALAGLILGYLGIAGTLFFVVVIAAFKDEIVSAVDVEIELQSAADAQHAYHEDNGRYTANLAELEEYGYVDVSGGVDVEVVSATSTTFCITGETLGEKRYIDQVHDTPTSTPCG